MLPGTKKLSELIFFCARLSLSLQLTVKAGYVCGENIECCFIFLARLLLSLQNVRMITDVSVGMIMIVPMFRI